MVSDLMIVFDCLDGLQMRGSIRWQELHVLENSENRSMDITTLTYWAAVWRLFCPSGASSVPKWGKHVTQHGQARFPSRADFVLSDRIINCRPSTIGWGHNDITE